MRLILPLMLLLAGCDNERPPAPTAEESERLDDAEAMLDEAAGNEGAR